MRRLLLSSAVLIASLSCSADEKPLNPARPPITGIALVVIRVSDTKTALDFYGKELGLGMNSVRCGDPDSPCLALGGSQFVALDRSAVPSSSNLIMELFFATSDVVGLQRYLTAHGLHPGEVGVSESGKRNFLIKDPDGHLVAFIESQPGEASSTPSQVSARLIHAGFVVRDRAAEDKFYKDILGFHVYWHGGMKEGEDNWVDMQVPDGTDWIEYMLRVSPDASHKTLGVMNHIALGVPDIHAAQQQLIKNGWKSTEEPKIGRDGKWQLNLYDPDETRVELMEFKPTKEPCCSAYTGPHPGPQQ
jgi:catechol 2,3-dioxygenase-like lactoylglutathione lyase family enzyme